MFTLGQDPPHRAEDHADFTPIDTAIVVENRAVCSDPDAMASGS